VTHDVIEFGKQIQISAELQRRMDKESFGQIIKEMIRKDAQAQNYTEVSEPELFLGEQSFRIVGNDDDGYEYVSCSPEDDGAFFYAGAKMRVVKSIEKELNAKSIT
jgi:hypothetical protein